MAQARRKRRSKHRGNAAGTIEARGRTGRPPSPTEKKKVVKEQARERRLNTRPTWTGSFKRAGLAAGFMLVILIFIEKGTFQHKLLSAAFVSLLAVVLYAPAGYYLEVFLWRRRMAKQKAALK